MAILLWENNWFKGIKSLKWDLTIQVLEFERIKESNQDMDKCVHYGVTYKSKRKKTMGNNLKLLT